MVGFVVVSHNKKLVDEAIRLAKIMPHENFPIINAGGLENSDDFGTDATIIMNAINEANKGDGVLVFCELGSSCMNSQMAVDMIDDKNVRIVDVPLVEGLVVGVPANGENVDIDDLEEEILEIKNFNKR